jgi:hypothetical protein
MGFLSKFNSFDRWHRRRTPDQRLAPCRPRGSDDPVEHMHAAQLTIERYTNFLWVKRLRNARLWPVAAQDVCPAMSIAGES